MLQLNKNLTNRQRKALLVVAFISLALFAATVNIVAAALIHISNSYQLEVEALGRLYLLEFLGFYIAVLFGGYLSDKYGKKIPLIIGSILMAFGTGGFSFSHTLFAGAIFLFLFGAGGGLIEGMGTALVRDLFPANPRKMLNFSQAFFCIGALGGPILAGHLLDCNVSWRLIFGLFAILICPLIFAYKYLCFPTISTRTGVNIKNVVKIIKDWKFIFLNIIMFLYVGAEMGIASWVCVFLSKTFNITASEYGLALAAFWLGLISGRLLCGAILARISDKILILISLSASIVFQILALGTNNPSAAAILYFLVGLSLACIWPTIISMVSGLFPHYSSTAIGVTVGSGGLAAFIFPFLLGKIAMQFGIKFTMVGPIIISGLNLLLFLLFFNRIVLKTKL